MFREILFALVAPHGCLAQGGIKNETLVLRDGNTGTKFLHKTGL